MSDVSTNDLQKLRSCPFCGGEVKISTYRNEGYQIECPNHEWPKRGMWGEKRPESDIAADIGMFTWGISDEAKEALIDAWNTRADDVPEHPVDKAQADSREQLEADIAEWCNNDSGEISALKRWLDRQDAITRREFESECEFCQSEVARLQEQMDNLTAERDDLRRITNELKERNGELLEYRARWIDQAVSIYRYFYPGNECAVPADVCSMVLAKIDELTAERDELREELEDEKSENGWARDFLNRMGPKCGTADCPSLVAYVNNLEAERDVLHERLDAMKAVLDKWVKPTVGVEPPEHPMVQLQPNDGDSRERLEADVYDGFSDVALSEQMRDVLRSRVHAWLDRQEAITSSEWCYSHDALEEEVERLRGRLKEEMEDVRTLDIEGHVLADKLAAAEDMLHVVMKGGEPNYDEWIWQHDGLSDWFQENFTKTVPQLTAELDKANEAGDKLMNKLIDMTTERDELREYATEKIAEFADKQRVIDVQRESFRKMEKDCADMSMALDKACKETGDTTGSCPWDKYNVKPRDCDKECKNQLAECWRLYFEGVRHGEEGSEG